MARGGTTFVWLLRGVASVTEFVGQVNSVLARHVHFALIGKTELREVFIIMEDGKN